jgi:beta-lactamase class A
MSDYERVIITIYKNDAQSESPYEHGMKREDKTPAARIMYLLRAISNGLQDQVLGC